jgi:hypothetical protein
LEKYKANEQAKLDKYIAREREKLVLFIAKEREKQEHKETKRREDATKKTKTKTIPKESTIQSIRHLFTVVPARAKVIQLPRYYLAILKKLEGRKKPKVINSIHAVRRRYER